MSRRLIFGPAPGRGPAGALPFAGRSGAFLAELVGLASFEEIRAMVLVQNVLTAWPGKNGKGDAFPLEDARRAALRFRVSPGDRVLFVGRDAGRAFEFSARFLVWRPFRLAEAAIIPHPSGINRWWNDAGNRSAGAEFLRNFLRGGDG
jgi:uracil-DNA glycosylase